MDPWFTYGFPLGAVAIGLTSAVLAWRSSRAFDKRHPHLVTSHVTATSKMEAVVHRVPGEPPSQAEDGSPSIR